MKRYYTGHAVIIALTLIPLILVQKKSAQDSQLARLEYKKIMHAETLAVVDNINKNIGDIYDSLRDISFLPDVRMFDSQQETLDKNVQTIVRMIYADLNKNVDVSEIYVTSSEFDPENPAASHRLQMEPIIAFDEIARNKGDDASLMDNIIFNMGKEGMASASATEPHGDETSEYRLIYTQIQWMKQYFSSLSKVRRTSIPMISGPEVITCDNRFFSETKNDKDRSGIVFSVPFYGVDGTLKGAISATVLTNALRAFIPSKDAVLINNLNDYMVFGNEEGQHTISKEWVERASPDPDLYYSEVIAINTMDPRSNWLLWTGRPNSDFEKTPLAKSVREFKIFWSWMIIASMLFLMGVWGVISRNMHKTTELLQKIADTAKESSKAKSEFLSNVSHELRTPLNSILGMMQLLEDHPMQAGTREMFNDIKRSGKNLLDTVNDILDLSKIEARMVHLEYLSFDAYENIRHVANSLRPMARNKGLTLSCKTDAEHLYVLGDSLRFTRILTNLVSNAVRYTDKGSIDIDVTATKSLSGMTRVRCTITDTGIGIPRDKHNKVFEKFIQADISTTRRYGGTGLGLTITKELVELMDGTIGLESEPGKGSAFWFEIPFEVTPSLHATSEKRPEAAQNPSGIPIRKARILVDEDHDMNQRLMRKIFDSLGASNYKIVDTGKQALEEIKANPYDLIIMDCHMPEMDGYEATIAIRSMDNFAHSQTPIVAITANAMPEDEQLCLAAGMNGYISKPIDIQRFKFVLSQWISFDETETLPTPLTGSTTPERDMPFDISTLEKNAQGDTAFIREIIGLFIMRSAAQIAELKTACTDDNNENWVETAHALKGTAGSIGAETMRTLCAEAQDMSHATATMRKEKITQIEKEYEYCKKKLIEKELYTCST